MILVVDDHEDSRNLLVKVLSLDGFDVQGAGTHLEALRWLQGGGVSCLVVDYQMPHVDGVALAKMVRHSATGSRTRIVLYSSYDAVLPDDAVASGIDAIIIKARQPWRSIIEALERECRIAESPMAA